MERFSMTSNAAIEHDLISHVMHSTLFNGFVWGTQSRPTKQRYCSIGQDWSSLHHRVDQIPHPMQKTEYPGHNPTFILIFFYTPLGLMWHYVQCTVSSTCQFHRRLVSSMITRYFTFVLQPIASPSNLRVLRLRSLVFRVTGTRVDFPGERVRIKSNISGNACFRPLTWTWHRCVSYSWIPYDDCFCQI